MIQLKCLRCGLTIPYARSDADVCPRCLTHDRQAVHLIPVSDETSTASARSLGRLSIDTRVLGDRHTLILNGELDIGSAPVLEAALAEACAAGSKEVVLDMGCVEFIDSSGLNAILRGRAECERRECAYWLTPAQRPAQGVFKRVGVIDRLRFRKATVDPSPQDARSG